jgi:hypothetical protein
LTKAVPAWARAPYTEADVMALKALAAGNANERQQQQALRWIVQAAAGVDDLSFQPGSADRETAFMEGRRFVGLQCRKLVEMRGELMKGASSAKP